jgi:hypothetical protein
MFDARRPIGRLFYLLPVLTGAWALTHAQAPSTTTVADTVFSALGNTTNFASGPLGLWSAGGAAISYSTSYAMATIQTWKKQVGLKKA